MSNFTENLTLQNPDKDCRIWYLANDFSYDIGAEYSGKRITVPAGFATDGTSIPRVLWFWEPPWSRAARASIIHDYLCDYLRTIGPHPLAPTRLDADNILFEALLVCGIPRYKALIFYYSVRIFGRSKLIGRFANMRERLNLSSRKE